MAGVVIFLYCCFASGDPQVTCSSTTALVEGARLGVSVKAEAGAEGCKGSKTQGLTFVVNKMPEINIDPDGSNVGKVRHTSSCLVTPHSVFCTISISA